MFVQYEFDEIPRCAATADGSRASFFNWPSSWDDCLQFFWLLGCLHGGENLGLRTMMSTR